MHRLHSYLLVTLGLFLLNISSPYGEEVEVRKDLTVKYENLLDRNSEVYLEGSDCTFLISQAKELYLWQQKMDMAKEIKVRSWKVPKCKKVDRGDGNDRWQVKVRTYLPQKAQEVLCVGPYCDGPNCYNCSLYFTNIVYSFRYVDSEEINYWLKGPLCERVSRYEEKKLGDIIVINNKDSDYLKTDSLGVQHTFVFLTPYLSFEKRHDFIEGTFKLEKYEELLKRFSVVEKCQDQVGKSSSCQRWLETYRCHNFKEIHAKLSSRYKSKRPYYDNLLRPFEEYSEGLLFKKKILTKGDLIKELKVVNKKIERLKKLKGIKKLEKSLQNFTYQDLKWNLLSKEDSWNLYVGGLVYRYKSLLIQFELFARHLESQFIVMSDDKDFSVPFKRLKKALKD